MKRAAVLPAPVRAAARRWMRAATALAVVLVTAGCGTTVPLGATRGFDRGATSDAGVGHNGVASGAVPTGVSGAAAQAVGPTGSVGGSQRGATGAAGPVGAVGAVTAAGATAPAGPGSSQSTAAAGGIPLTGRGWDAKHVYIGVPTADDFNSVMGSYGANFSNGSTEGDVGAIVADINRSGGILGRQLVAVYHNTSTANFATDPSGTAQSMCTYFTQDQPVMAVINGAPQLDSIDSFHKCLEQYGVSLFSFTNTDYDSQDYQALGPHLWTVASLSTDTLIPTLVSALHRQGFFEGWDSLNGRPGTAPVKVGILEPDTPQGEHVAALFKTALARISVPVVSVFFYNTSGDNRDSQNQVLQFESAGVTHVLDLPPIEANILFFQLAAEQQHYHPRYGITSFDLPLSVEENSQIDPPDQQIGSMGIGWQPYNDVDAAHDPGALPGSARCLGALSRGGQTFNSSTRRAALIAVQFCDAIYLLRDAAVAGKGLTGSALLAGAALAGSRLATAGTFGSDLSSRNHGVPGYYRDLQYQAGCSCFAYSGPDQPFN